jgi:hypothetical protein
MSVSEKRSWDVGRIAGFYRGIILHETDGLLRSVIRDWSGRLYATGSGPGHVSTYAPSRLQL